MTLDQLPAEFAHAFRTLLAAAKAAQGLEPYIDPNHWDGHSAKMVCDLDAAVKLAEPLARAGGAK